MAKTVLFAGRFRQTQKVLFRSPVWHGLGRPLTWQDEGSMGEADVTGEATLVGQDISARNVRFRTEDSGTVVFRNVERHGQVEAREDGG